MFGRVVQMEAGVCRSVLLNFHWGHQTEKELLNDVQEPAVSACALARSTMKWQQVNVIHRLQQIITGLNIDDFKRWFSSEFFKTSLSADLPAGVVISYVTVLSGVLCGPL